MVAPQLPLTEHLLCARCSAGARDTRGNKLIGLLPSWSGLPYSRIIFTANLEAGIMTLRHSEAGDLQKHTKVEGTKAGSHPRLREPTASNAILCKLPLSTVM